MNKARKFDILSSLRLTKNLSVIRSFRSFNRKYAALTFFGPMAAPTYAMSMAGLSSKVTPSTGKTALPS